MNSCTHCGRPTQNWGMCQICKTAKVQEQYYNESLERERKKEEFEEAERNKREIEALDARLKAYEDELADKGLDKLDELKSYAKERGLRFVYLYRIEGKGDYLESLSRIGSNIEKQINESIIKLRTPFKKFSLKLKPEERFFNLKKYGIQEIVETTQGELKQAIKKFREISKNNLEFYDLIELEESFIIIPKNYADRLIEKSNYEGKKLKIKHINYIFFLGNEKEEIKNVLDVEREQKDQEIYVKMVQEKLKQILKKIEPLRLYNPKEFPTKRIFFVSLGLTILFVALSMISSNPFGSHMIIMSCYFFVLIIAIISIPTGIGIKVVNFIGKNVVNKINEKIKFQNREVITKVLTKLKEIHESIDHR